MTRQSTAIFVRVAVVIANLCPTALATDAASTKTLVAFDASFVLESATTQDAKLKLQRRGTDSVLRVGTGHQADWPGITIAARERSWDLSPYTELVLEVHNVDSKPVTVNCRVDCLDGDGDKNSLTGNVTLQPTEQKVLKVQLVRQLPEKLSTKLFGMRGYPGGAKEKGIDASQITQLIVFVNKPRQDHSFELGSIRARGAYQQGDWSRMSPDEFFPMIDRFGQFAHKQWPGKTNSQEDLRQVSQDELEDLTAFPTPNSWNQYGGWTDGPQLAATGYYYPTKQGGKWWLVDPAGRLFWSHGVDCVGFSQGVTPISDREFYFAELPPDDSPLARFYGSGSWAPHGYYQGKGTYRTFNFGGANLRREYGDDRYNIAANRTHKRLRSWALNTIANWSDEGIYLRQKTPYVVAAGCGGAQSLEGSTGYWGKFPDPFDPSFRQALDRRLRREKERSAGDPWCIGYFVDNELAWGGELSLATATLASPPEQAAKQVFLTDLKAKYETIRKLNDAWDTSHESWEALSISRTPPDEQKAAADLGAFYTKIAEAYFRHCRDAVKRIAPDNLYLGCRFAWVNDRGARAAAKYCDVIGYNLYRDDVRDFQLPAGLDKPVIVGEFHFGALDRGMFHTGLRPTASQEDRAKAYRNYVSGALANPYIVGTHWFQFGDQATTGRGDGENYQIGLVDICDKPYAETIEAVREIGYSMYETRLHTGVTAPE